MRNGQRYSEACRPVIGKHADGILGRVIDLFALFALLAGTAATFSVATSLMARPDWHYYDYHDLELYQGCEEVSRGEKEYKVISAKPAGILE